MRGIATLTELETTWSLDDAERALAVLSATDYLEAKAMETVTPCKIQS